MTYLLTLTQSADFTLATTQPVVAPGEVAPLVDALALSDELSELIASQHASLAAAEAEAREAGEAAGRAAGAAAAQDEAALALADTLAEITAGQRAQRDELRQALIALAGAMVRRMTAELAPADVLAALAERAFEHVVPPQPVRLRLPPQLADGVRAALAQRELAMPVQCVPDADLDGVRCVVESAAGTLLAGLDEALAQGEQTLATSLRTRAAAAEETP